MRLLTYQSDDGFKLGIKTAQGILDVAAAAAAAGAKRAITPDAVYRRGNAVLARLSQLAAATDDAALFHDEGDLTIGPSRAQSRQDPMRRLELSEARG